MPRLAVLLMFCMRIMILSPPIPSAVITEPAALGECCEGAAAAAANAVFVVSSPAFLEAMVEFSFAKGITETT